MSILGLVRADDIRVWVANRRAGDEREREEMRRDGNRNVIHAALGLIAVAGRLLGWPPPADPSDDREEEIARDTWVRLRKRLASKS